MPREIVVNGRFLSRCVTGVERYGRGILSVIGSSSRVEETRQNGIAGHAWEQFILPAKLNPKSMLWSPANTGPLFVRNQALTIHDLSPLEHPEWFRARFETWYRLLLPLLTKHVRMIFTPSEYMKKKIIKRFGVDNVTVTPNGVDPSVFHPDAIQTSYEIAGKYILFVGSIQPRKNLARLIAAWHEIKDEFKDIYLVIAGDAGRVFRTEQFFEDKQIRFLSRIPDADLPGLYARAELFVLPSLDEGFGLPVLEAMACGTPVLVSNAGALPEVAGDAAVIFDVANPAELTASLKCCLQNSALRMSLKEKGLTRAKNFSWQHPAEMIWKMLNEN